MNERDYKLQIRTSEEKQKLRNKLIELYKKCQIPVDEIIVNLGLFLRSSVLAKFLYINELYQEIIRIPGIIMEFGVGWGQNIVLFESFRAIYEPYDYTRKIVGFDTFTGYTSISEKDGDDPLVKEGGYAVGENYLDYLKELLNYHEAENTMSHIKKYELVRGDASKTITNYLDKHPETIVSLAYFDMGLYEPTKKCLEAIIPYTTKGTIIAMDELNSFEFPGETIALKETIGLKKNQILRSNYLPDRSYIKIE